MTISVTAEVDHKELVREVADLIVRKLEAMSPEDIMPEEYDDDDWDGPPREKAIESPWRALGEAIKQTVLVRCKDAIDKGVEDAIKESLEVRFQETDRWGAAKGSPATLQEYIDKRITAVLGQRVDYEGKPCTSSYGNRGKAQYLDWLIGKRVETEVREMFDKSISETLKEARERAVSALQAQLATAMAGARIEVRKG